jgi:hypothetical protein
MRATRKLDSKIHFKVFGQKQDICPKYSKDFDATAVLLEMLLLQDCVNEVSIGWCPVDKIFYCKIEIEVECHKEITIKKFETTKEKAVCSAILEYCERIEKS